jgi:hypothetical protein
MLLQEPDPGMVDGWLIAVPVAVRDAVFGNHDFRRPVLPSSPCEPVVEPPRIDLLPACGRDWIRLKRLPVTIEYHWGVVVDSKKVDRNADGGQVLFFDCPSQPHR